jgi:hypothetical protein
VGLMDRMHPSLGSDATSEKAEAISPFLRLASSKPLQLTFVQPFRLQRVDTLAILARAHATAQAHRRRHSNMFQPPASASISLVRGCTESSCSDPPVTQHSASQPRRAPSTRP